MIRVVEDAVLSLFQSAVEDLVRRRTGATDRPGIENPLVHAAAVYGELRHAGQPVPEAAPAAVAAQGGAGSTAWTCVRLTGDLLLAKVKGDAARVQQIEDDLKDSECDPGWLETIATYVEFFGVGGQRRAIPYVRHRQIDDFVYDALPPDALVALVGDWGTGMPRAVTLLEQVARHEPQALIHLGDIYYAGTADETRLHFQAILDRVIDRARTRVYAIPGNHEMYSGGTAFYAMLPTLNLETPQQASYFSLRTTDGAWQLLGMDTGLHDHDPFDVTSGMTFLEPDEVVWHVDKVDRVHARGGRTILLSHHQLFSAFDAIGTDVRKPAGEEAYNTNLLNAFRSSLAAGKVSAWFWGHAHNLEIYQPYGALAKGRCIGHGAIPVWTTLQPYRTRTDLPDPPRLVKDAAGREVQLPVGPDGVYDIGFALVRFQGPTAEVQYYVTSDPHRPLYVETLT
jgi:hypothetical protein